LKLGSQDIQKVRAMGLYVDERCDGCPKLLNQSVRWTIKGQPWVFCSERCRDVRFEHLQRRGELKHEPRMPQRARHVGLVKPESEEGRVQPSTEATS